MRKWSFQKWLVCGMLAGSMMLPGCGKDADEDDDDTAAPVSNVIKSVSGIAAIGPEEHLGSADSSHPTIAVDGVNQPHIYTDQDRDNVIFEYHKINGAWSAEHKFAEGIPHAKYKASRMYLPHIAIDSKNRGWLSAKFGNKEWGSFLGQGFWVINNMSNSPTEALFKYVGINKGNGNIDVDPFEPDNGVLFVTDGAWNKFDASGNFLSGGVMDIGVSGEKMRFAISPRAGQVGVWHAAMNGFSRQDSSYNNSDRAALGQPPVPWANYAKHTEMGDDYYHPGIGIDWANPSVCYLSADFDAGVVINVFNGNGMLFAAGNLPVLDSKGHTGCERMGPQWAPLPGGGAYVCWTRMTEGRVKMQMVRSDGSMVPAFGQEPLDICAGSRASICTDTEGNIHMAYNNGGTCYRKIQLAVNY